jgi:methenyltetrahydromethanopterin cyclohydrolase
MYEKISLTKEALPFLRKILDNSDRLNVVVSEQNGAKIIDCGLNTIGSIEAGILFTKISLGGLATVSVGYDNNSSFTAPTVQVTTAHPVLATLGCQAASWNINKKGFFGMACGPGRALAQKPSRSYKLLNYQDNNSKGIICLEADKMPTDEVIDYLAEKCSVNKENLFLLLIKTNCLVEFVQMAARAIELGIFRLVEQLGYAKEKVLHAIGTGIIPSVSDNKEIANDRVNNGLIYGTRLHLSIRSDPEDDLTELLPKVPSNASSSYGKRFQILFEEAGKDFANFDLTLLAPSELVVNDFRTGKKYHYGKIDTQFLE